MRGIIVLIIFGLFRRGKRAFWEKIAEGNEVVKEQIKTEAEVLYEVNSGLMLAYSEALRLQTLDSIGSFIFLASMFLFAMNLGRVTSGASEMPELVTIFFLTIVGTIGGFLWSASSGQKKMHFRAVVLRLLEMRGVQDEIPMFSHWSKSP